MNIEQKYEKLLATMEQYAEPSNWMEYVEEIYDDSGYLKGRRIYHKDQIFTKGGKGYTLAQSCLKQISEEEKAVYA